MRNSVLAATLATSAASSSCPLAESPEVQNVMDHFNNILRHLGPRAQASDAASQGDKNEAACNVGFRVYQAGASCYFHDPGDDTLYNLSFSGSSPDAMAIGASVEPSGQKPTRYSLFIDHADTCEIWEMKPGYKKPHSLRDIPVEVCSGILKRVLNALNFAI